MNKELKAIIEYFGTQEKLCNKLNSLSPKKCTQQNISYWLRSPNGVPRYWASLLIDIYPDTTLKKLLFPALTK